ncbi:MAG: tetratricopeptide repeat protein [Gammaproteobacteria bacterium]|nr:tetratricopeptide repeat protein [Gammaproteobacteria bacterium]
MTIRRVSNIVFCLAAAWLAFACTSPEERAKVYFAEAQRLFDEGNLTKATLEAKNAIQIEPNNPQSRLLLAKILEKEGDFQGVFNNLRIAVDADPNLIEARIKLGALYTAAGMLPEAQVEIDAVLQQEPDNVDAQVLAARLLAQNGNENEAEAVLRGVLEINPAKTDALILLVGITVNKDPDAALVLIEQGLLVADDPRNLRVLRVEILQRLDRAAEVESEFQALINAYPDDNAFRFGLAQYLLNQGRVDDVEQLLRDIIDVDPESVAARLALVQFLASVRGPDVAQSTLSQFVNEAPETYQLQVALGRLYEAMKEPERAIEEYEAVIAGADKSDEGLTARNQIARILIQEDKIEEGRVYIDEVLAIDSGNIEALMMHGGLALVDGEYREAIKDFRDVLRKEPDQERAHYLLARTHLQAGDKILAKDAYRRVIEISPKNGDAVMELAQILFADKQTTEVESLLRGRLSIAPDDARASQMLIGLLVNQNQYVTAETEARRLIEINSDNGLAEYLLGAVLQVQERSDEAITYFAKALEKSPASPEALQGYTAVLIDIKGQAAAVRYLEAHIEKYPDQLYPTTLLSKVQAGSGDVQAAEQTLKSALQKNEAWLPAYTGLASMQADDIGKQIEIFEDGMKAIPGNQQLGLLLGTAYEREGRIEEAIEMYEGLLEQNPDMPAVVNNLAALIADFRQDVASLELALELLEGQKLIETGNPAFVDTVGWVHYRLGNNDVAVEYLEQAVAGAGQVPILHYHLGMAYLAAGNQMRAQEELDVAVSNANNDFTGIDVARETLKQLQSQ